ncbi:MAG: ATP-binding protein, partial [Chloroflexota bacterium]
KMIAEQPTLSVVLFHTNPKNKLPVEIDRLGLIEGLTTPLRPDQVLSAVKRGLARSRKMEEWVKYETRRKTGALEQRVSELETLASVGQAVTAELELERVLMVVVEAAVTFSGAEEGSLLLLDENTGELYMAAGRNFHDEFVRTFRLPVQDTIAGGVVATGEPVFINENTPRKILTSYLVYSLIYVPLIFHGRVIGVLGVDHRSSGHTFEQRDLQFLSALGDYAAIAIENAQLYNKTDYERHKLESILTQIEDGVVVVDFEGKVLLINDTIREAFTITDNDVSGKLMEDVFANPELRNALRVEFVNSVLHEIESENGHVFNAQTSKVEGVGTVTTLHDITYLKEIDRLKSDFVNAVSHDLRSPLTAILGYVELIGRLGEVNEQQKEFIGKIQMGVHNITDLINNLLDLGRIEVGIGDNIEEIKFDEIIAISVENVQTQLNEKNQELAGVHTGKWPVIIGDPTQLRQMLENLLANASKYTPEGGAISLIVKEEDDQLIMLVKDSGIGIPEDDQARIFDRFYRASNTPDETQGTGLGLAIVRRIVDNHRGRIWVDSTLGEGSTFTVVLPIAKISSPA